MKKKLLLTGLLAITVVTFLEIAIYFVYIFKPIDRITGRDLGVLRGIPTASEILTPIGFSQYISQTYETKKFYSDRVGNFSDEVDSVMQANSSFIKTIEANYTVAGTVQDVKNVKDANNPLLSGYDIIIRNSAGSEYVEHIKPSEALYVGTSLVTISTKNYSNVEKDLNDIKKGDYLMIKRSFNLLNPSEENIEIEILRTNK